MATMISVTANHKLLVNEITGTYILFAHQVCVHLFIFSPFVCYCIHVHSSDPQNPEM